MTTNSGTRDTAISPAKAFAVLGNDARMEIVRTLSDVDKPMPFSELQDAVGLRDSGTFNYHLDQLVGHFVRKAGDHYTLSQAGRRVVEAILSGAMTETVVLEPTRIDANCPYCGADVEVSYREERLLVRCPDCVGTFAGSESPADTFGTDSEGAITLSRLPSAGFRGRQVDDLIDVAHAWNQTENVLNANGICPRCSGVVDHTPDVCIDHEPDPEICDRCDGRWAVMYESRCRVCDHERAATIVSLLLGDVRFRSFIEGRGYPMHSPNWFGESPLAGYEETVLSVDPFEARFTFRDAGDELVVGIDDDLQIIEYRLQ